MKKFLAEFRDFVNRGNVVDLAVAVVIGAAFGAVIKSFTDHVLMQVVAAIAGEPDFSALTIEIGDGKILYGAFLNAVISFLIVAFAMFLVVKAFNAMQNMRKKQEAEAAPAGPSELDVLLQIRDELRARQ